MSVKLWKKIENRKKQKQKHKRIQKVCLRSPSPAQTSAFVSSTAAGLHSLPILRSFGALPGPNRGTEADFNKKRSPNFDSLKHPSFQPYEPFPYTNSIRQIHPTIRSVRFPNFYPQNMARLGALLATPFVSAFAPWENIDANYGIIWKSC